MKITVGRSFHFDAAHYLEEYQGNCEKLHGHTYRLEVEASGPIGKEGMVLDFSRLKEIVQQEILQELDHADLNQILEQPTAENIAQWIYQRLEERLKEEELVLKKITVWEGKGKWVSITQ